MKNTTFPALRCKMGEWIYYLTFFKFSDVVDWIKPTDQIHTSKQLRDMIQRALTNNADSIANYLLLQAIPSPNQGGARELTLPRDPILAKKSSINNSFGISGNNFNSSETYLRPRNSALRSLMLKSGI